MAYSNPADAREYNRQWRARNPDYKREWRKRNPEKGRAEKLRSRFNLTVEAYDELLESQCEVCAICGDECDSGHRLSVDHDHETGEVRGLLCKDCNIALGFFRDNVKSLARAIEYLSKED